MEHRFHLSLPSVCWASTVGGDHGFVMLGTGSYRRKIM